MIGIDCKRDKMTVKNNGTLTNYMYICKYKFIPSLKGAQCVTDQEGNESDNKVLI